MQAERTPVTMAMEAQDAIIYLFSNKLLSKEFPSFKHVRNVIQRTQFLVLILKAKQNITSAMKTNSKPKNPKNTANSTRYGNSSEICSCRTIITNTNGVLDP